MEAADEDSLGSAESFSRSDTSRLEESIDLLTDQVRLLNSLVSGRFPNNASDPLIDSGEADAPAFFAQASKRRVDLGALAQRIYRSRRIRDDLFKDPNIFGEPCWDILLDLLVAEENGQRVPVTSACIGACVPSTTALRWLNILEKKGLIVREEDIFDKRRVFVRLSASGLALIRKYLIAIAET